MVLEGRFSLELSLTKKVEECGMASFELSLGKDVQLVLEEDVKEVEEERSRNISAYSL